MLAEKFKNKLLLVVFFVWLFFLAVWGEAPAGASLLALFAFFSLFTGIVKSKQLLAIFSQYKLPLLIWILFLTSLLASCFFTLNLPLSLKELIYFFTAFLFFWQVLLFKNTILENKKDFTLGLIAITTCLVIISLFLSLTVTANIALPAMNILRPIAGHNHLASWLILVLPVVWWWFFDQAKVYKLFFLLLFILALYMSMGRVALFLAFLQFLTILFLLRRKIQTKFPTFVKSLLLLSLVLSLSFLVIQIANTRFRFLAHSSCLSCKFLSLQSRFYYWQQAVYGLKQNLYFGSGPGTFALINIKYYQLPGYQTAYAHNIFINTLAEAGVFGFLAFLLLIGYLLFLVIKKIKITNDEYFFILLIGALGSLFNALLDFDWHFSVIFFLTLAYFALILEVKKKENTQLSIWLKLVFSKLFFLLGLLVASYHLFLYLSTTFFSYHFFTQAFDFFPYYYQQRDLYLEKFTQNQDERLHRLIKIYWHDPEFIRYLVTKSPGQDSFGFYHQRLRVLDPWYGLYRDQIRENLELGKPELAKNELESILSFWSQKKIQYGYDLRYERQLELVDDAIKVGESFFQNGEYQEAGELYRLAQTIDPWILAQRPPIFLNLKPNLSHLEFFIALKDVDPKYFGDQNRAYGKYLHFLALESLNADQPALVPVAVDLNLNIIPWDNHQLWIDILPVFKKKLAEELKTVSDPVPTLLLDLATHDTLCQVANAHERDVDRLWPVALKQDFTNSLQKAANLALAAGDQSRAENYVKTMKLLLKDEYWPAAQLAHFYVYLGRNDLGFREFEACLRRFADQHDDCFYGKRDIARGKPNQSRYFQVSQIILGQKNWWEF